MEKGVRISGFAAKGRLPLSREVKTPPITTFLFDNSNL